MIVSTPLRASAQRRPIDLRRQHLLRSRQQRNPRPQLVPCQVDFRQRLGNWEAHPAACRAWRQFAGQRASATGVPPALEGQAEAIRIGQRLLDERAGGTRLIAGVDRLSAMARKGRQQMAVLDARRAAVTHAMQPRQRSTWGGASAVGIAPSSTSFIGIMRPVAVHLSPSTLYVGR